MSVAVTVIVAVSPWLRLRRIDAAARRWGWSVESVAEVIVSGLTGCESFAGHGVVHDRDLAILAERGLSR